MQEGPTHKILFKALKSKTQDDLLVSISKHVNASRVSGEAQQDLITSSEISKLI